MSIISKSHLRIVDLGTDIIESELIPYLTPSEILQLQLTCKELYHLVNNSPFVWQQLYKKTFGTIPTPFTKWGPDKYTLRSKAKVYSWGCFSGGRLGYSLKDVPNENVSKIRFNMGIMRPTLIPGLDDEIVADVSAGGFSFQLLTASGKIFTTGSSYHQGHLNEPGPMTNDYNKFQIRNNTYINFFPVDVGRRGDAITPTQGTRPTPIPQTITETSPFLYTPMDPHPSYDLKKSNKFLKREYTTKDSLKFVTISSGRSHFIALDNAGRLWSWDRSEFGVKIGFESREPLTKGKDLVSDLGFKILKVSAGWGYSVAYLYNYGLVYWKRRDALTDENEEEVKAHYHLVPGTRVNNDNKEVTTRVVDFVALENCIIFITQDGKLWKINLSSESNPLPLTGFQTELTNQSQWPGCKFTRLTGCYQHFAAFSENDDYVFIGSNLVEPETKPLIIPEIQQRKCLDVRFGDHHYMALLGDGSLLSWGIQLSNCGCLGLGPVESIENGRIIDIHNSTVRVDKPTKINLPVGKVVIAIAASGWQSSAIII